MKILRDFINVKLIIIIIICIYLTYEEKKFELYVIAVKRAVNALPRSYIIPHTFYLYIIVYMRGSRRGLRFVDSSCRDVI